MKREIRILLCLFALLQITSCKKDKVTPECDGSHPTYDGAIKAIIDASCTSSSCHGAGSSRGDFTTYDGLQPDLLNGEFRKRALEKQTMPKGGSLSQDQLNLIQCWNDDGYPEN